MVYHRSESGSADSRRHRDRYSRDEDSSSSESNRDDRDKSREGKYSSSRSRSNRDDKYSDRSSKNSKGREGSRFGDSKGESSRPWDNNEGSRPWDNSSGFRDSRPADNRFGAGPRFFPNAGVPVDQGVFRNRDSGQFNQQVAQYPMDSYQYHHSEPQKLEEDKQKNVFQNDGSFLEMFKKMQESKPVADPVLPSCVAPAATSSTSSSSQEESVAALAKKLPMVGKRRGGRVLKTGMVKKLKLEKPEDTEPKNAWSMYMNEVRKYKEASCEEEGKTRPLVK